MSSFINSITPPKKEKNETADIKDVYIGVFFDGTNNNMVQTARYGNTGKNIFTKITQSTYNGVKKAVWWVADKTPWRDEEELNANLYEEYKKHGLEYGGYTKKDKGKKGYSNIAILHDNYCLNSDVKKRNCIFKHFYIEGAGATDTSHYISMNPNGLGFGLGLTSVTALVSKAVKYISEYVAGINVVKNKAKIHFYVFGFSRGATCARLFSHIVTRNDGETITREKEFCDYYAKKYYDKDREYLSFLKDYEKKVELLGIYDTVASIGYLKQKDGEVHPVLRRALHGLAGNYHGNWHYKNATEYGLYLNKDSNKLGHVCHICAMDEFRENFALTDVGSTVPEKAIELFVPGCHSDVGGGYIDGEEQEIVLVKDRKDNWPDEESEQKIEEKNIKSFILGEKGAKTFISFDPPQQLKDNTNNIEVIGEKALVKAGWVDEKWDNKKEALTTKIDGKKKQYTLRVIDNSDKVKFKRNVKGGYSNITLRMMISFSNQFKSQKEQKDEFPDFLFPLGDILYYGIPADLVKMGEGMVDKTTKATSGQRKWIYPEGGYYGDQYKKLRMKYLHFTSTCEIYHLNNPFNFKGVHTVEGTAGNLGNTPNFDLEGRLCRIVYHGDKTDSKSLNVKNCLHYMYEYNVNNAEKVTCDVKL